MYMTFLPCIVLDCQENLLLEYAIRKLNNSDESVMELHNDILHLKTPSTNFNLKAYESISEEEVQYPDIPQYIIQPPQILYTSKWQPALVQCVAEPVILLYIVCVTNPTNSNARYDYGTENVGSPVYQANQKFKHHGELTDLNLTQNSTVNNNNKQNRKMAIRLIDENTVEEWFGDYWCQCEAWNNILSLGEPRVKISNQTHVRIAYLNKRFLKQPESTRIPLGWTVEFTCEPPDGRPIPKVYWMKNGRKLKYTIAQDRIIISEMNLSTAKKDILNNYEVVNHEASVNYSGLISRLMIRNTNLVDEGIYTCVVENQAGRRVSSNAQLTIHTDGHWSSWSSWSDCPSECAISPLQTVHKILNHSNLFGSNDKSTCPPQCRRSFGQRTRWCNAPEPHGGGRKCYGENLEHLSCYDICLDNLTNSIHNHLHEDFSINDNTRVITPSEYGLLFGLVLAILSFLTAAMSVLYIFAHKLCPTITKFLTTEPIKSINLLHSSFKWPKCKTNENNCLTSNSTSLNVMNSMNQFIEYKSEIVSPINHSQTYLQEDCQQSLHYDCVSLMPLNGCGSKNMISLNHIYADHTIRPRIRPPLYRTHYNGGGKVYQFNDAKYRNSISQFRMDFVYESNPQVSVYNNQISTANTSRLPLHLTHSHSMHIINNLKAMQESLNPITPVPYNPNDISYQAEMLLSSRDSLHTSLTNQRHIFLPRTTHINLDSVIPYFSVALSNDTNENNHYLTLSNQQRITTNLIQPVMPTSSISSCDTTGKTCEYLYIPSVTYDSSGYMNL
ncbi:unnamed protein product [Heterobilharzia americana]|nr:unnamed protein product [Heterobilharzia americana]